MAYSILYGHDDIAETLIEAGAQSYYDENDQQKDYSPIFVAVQKGKNEILELMTFQSASLGVKNAAGMTPLMFAAEQNY